MRKIIEEEELRKIFEAHKKWLNCEVGGEKADLSGIDLSYIDLRGADLRYVNFSHSDLRGADLYGANFAGAILHDIQTDKNATKYQALAVSAGLYPIL